MSEPGYGDFEFERKFLVRALPTDLLVGSTPDVIVQSYYLASEGYALRVRLQAPAPEGPRRRSGDIAGILTAVAGQWSVCTLTAKGPAVGGTRYEAEGELDPLVAEERVGRGRPRAGRRGGPGRGARLRAGSGAPGRGVVAGWAQGRGGDGGAGGRARWGSAAASPWPARGGYGVPAGSRDQCGGNVLGGWGRRC